MYILYIPYSLPTDFPAWISNFFEEFAPIYHQFFRKFEVRIGFENLLTVLLFDSCGNLTAEFKVHPAAIAIEICSVTAIGIIQCAGGFVVVGCIGAGFMDILAAGLSPCGPLSE